jgi:ubiquitin carboxyl-terminal hydrolase 5/13
LAIAAETEEDRYDTKIQVKCYTDEVELPPTQGKLPAVVDGVLKASTFARQAEVQAWEQEFTPCEHTLCLEQDTSRQIASQGKFSDEFIAQSNFIRPWPLFWM